MKKYLYFLVGVLVGASTLWIWNNQLRTRTTTDASHVIEYEIKRMNKMVVAEQSFSDVYTHKSSLHLPKMQNLFSFDKKVMLLVNLKTQASYDLSKMDVKIDSKNKTIYINKIPNMELQTFPDVQFYEMDQSVVNKFSKDDLNEIKDNAVKAMEDKIDKKTLEAEARDQLMENLGSIYQMAKAYDWKVVDKTQFASELEVMFNY